MIKPCELADAYHVYHQYTIRTPERTELAAHLKKCEIGTMIYYPVPLHQQKLYLNLDEALGNGYLGEAGYENFLKRINEVGYLLNRMMKNVQRARDNYGIQRKSNRLHSIAKQ